MDNGLDGLPDPATEVRIPLHRGGRFVVDTQLLRHAVVHPGAPSRCALITRFESGPVLGDITHHSGEPASATRV